MQQLEKKFLQSIVKPLNDFQIRLVEPFVYSPTFSSISTDSSGIASAIAHFPEQAPDEKNARKTQEELRGANFEYNLLADFNNTVKHRDLKKKSRITDLIVYSRFEYSEDRGFRFMRTVPYLRPREKTLTKYDFIQVAIKSIQVLAEKFDFNTTSIQAFPAGTEDFSECATLYHSNDSREISVEGSNIEFVRRVNGDEYTLVDPPTVKFIVI